jgi:hypothetical protein
MRSEHPQVPLAFKVPTDVLEWVDQDVLRQHKANRSVWFNDLLVALRDGQLIPAHPVFPPEPAGRTTRPYPKTAVK